MPSGAAEGCGHFADNGFCRGGRVGGLRDGAADDEITGAAAEGFGRRGDALLIAGIGSRRADARNHQNRVRSGEGADAGGFKG